MSSIAPHPALYVSPEMVAELALGIDPPLQIAGKYNVSAAEFGELQGLQWFQDAIYRKREEFSQSGITFAVKSAMMAEELWQRLYTESLAANSPMKVEHKIDIAKNLTEFGGLKPKGPVGVAANGPAFQINISFPDNPQGPSKHTAHVATEAAEAMVIDLTPNDPIPPKPAGLKVPDFKLTNDLVGTPVPTTA